MDTFDKNMSQIFDIEVVTEMTENLPKIIETKPKESTENNNLENDLNVDYEKVRKNYEEIVEKGKNAIDEILAVARDSQHPRAYEVASTLINTVINANEKMIALQKQMRDMDSKTSDTGNGSTKIDKAVFIGSPSDINKMLKGTFNNGNQ